MRPYIYFTVFCAGLTALAAEFGASRLLQMRFSSINLVWAVIIGLILVYFAVGYYLGGQLADRSPAPRTLFSILAAGSGALALIPLIAQPVLRAAATATDTLNLGLMAGAFLATLILFSVPVTLLATTTPFAVRLLIQDAKNVGVVSGKISAISTIGSVLGAFLPSIILFPWLGTSLTITMLGIFMLIVSMVGLLLFGAPRRAVLAFIFIVLALTLGLTADFHIKDTPGQIFETESDYNYIEVIERNGYRYLRLNDGQGVHSQYHPDELFYGGPWEQFLVGPLFNQPPFMAHDVKRIAIVGLAAGTSARQATAIFGPVPIDGWEIDQKIVNAGRDYFGMTMPNLTVHVTDGRWGLEHSPHRYTLIAVDAYRPPYIPVPLTTREFFQIAYDHLDENGVLAINIGRTDTDRRLIEDLAATIGEIFPSIYVMDIPNTFNSILYATRQPTRPDNLSANLMPLLADSAIHPLWRVAGQVTLANLQPAPQQGRVYTDDWAPIEWVTNDMILNFILNGNIDSLE